MSDKRPSTTTPDLASADDAAVLLTRCASLRHGDRDVRA
jgi:hypothetical protein